MNIKPIITIAGMAAVSLITYICIDCVKDWKETDRMIKQHENARNKMVSDLEKQFEEDRKNLNESMNHILKNKGSVLNLIRLWELDEIEEDDQDEQ